MATSMSPPTRSSSSSTAAPPAANVCSTATTFSKAAQPALGPSRRHSLPLNYIAPNLWPANTSTASLVESEEAARGEHVLDEATVAHRLTALRSLNGSTKTRHQYAKSTGARNSTYSQPVIVRTYSGARPLSQQRTINARKQNGKSGIAAAKMDLKLPPVKAFSFKGIMDEIGTGVDQDIQRIAEICARSRYSLSNQYEVHMPPHGTGDDIISTTDANGVGPSLQIVASEDVLPRQSARATRSARASRTSRRSKSTAFETLETIMSSSRSSDEDKSKKKSAAVLAGEVRGRAAKKSLIVKPEADVAGNKVTAGSHTEQARSKSYSFTTIMVESAHGTKQDRKPQILSPSISKPACPQTSTTDIADVSSADYSAGAVASPKLIRNESTASTLKAEPVPRSVIPGSWNTWLPWSKPTLPQARALSHAEGSLRNLLKPVTAKVNTKGKGIDRIP